MVYARWLCCTALERFFGAPGPTAGRYSRQASELLLDLSPRRLHLHWVTDLQELVELPRTRLFLQLQQSQAEWMLCCVHETVATLVLLGILFASSPVELGRVLGQNFSQSSTWVKGGFASER